MADIRLIDANSVCRSIVESIRHAEEWQNEAREQQDTIGLQYASNTYSSLISMLERIQNEPTIEAQPVKHGQWIIDYAEGTKIYHAHCSECNKEPDRNIGGDYYIDKLSDFCPNCGSNMREGGDNE